MAVYANHFFLLCFTFSLISLFVFWILAKNHWFQALEFNFFHSIFNFVRKSMQKHAENTQNHLKWKNFTGKLCETWNKQIRKRRRNEKNGKEKKQHSQLTPCAKLPNNRWKINEKSLAIRAHHRKKLNAMITFRSNGFESLHASATPANFNWANGERKSE